MSKRKSISKKIRFEVFKRDSFKCQYCGAAAPEVVLEVDHIQPVSKGGDNDLVNLVTSCHACNNGKRDKLLSDASEVEKQRRQIEELSERRQQLEMMLAWRDSVKGIEDEAHEALVNAVEDELHGFGLSENGRRNVRKWLKSHPLDLLLGCVEVAADQYLVVGSDDQTTDESFERFFRMIPRIAHHKASGNLSPVERHKDAYYARGILRNRLSYVNDRQALEWLKECLDLGIDKDALFDLCKQCRNWTQFSDEMELLRGKRDA